MQKLNITSMKSSRNAKIFLLNLEKMYFKRFFREIIIVDVTFYNSVNTTRFQLK